MKPHRFVMSACLIAVLLSGCTTVTKPDGTTSSELDTNKVIQGINRLVPKAAAKVCQRSAKACDVIHAVAAGVCGMTASGQVTTNDLRAVFVLAGVNELNTPEAQDLEDTVYTIYDIAYGNAVAAHLSDSQIVGKFVPILQALCFALESGLGNPSVSFIERQQQMERSVVRWNPEPMLIPVTFSPGVTTTL